MGAGTVGKEIANTLPEILKFIRLLDFDFVIAETSGIGQGNMAITRNAGAPAMVMVCPGDADGARDGTGSGRNAV